ncbi:MAG: hypothetical protein R2712_03385 [Vicinamibacterales bacterium]
MVNPDKSKEEGDLSQLDLFLGLSQIDAVDIPFDTQPGPRLVRQFTTYLRSATALEPGADAGTFLWTYYLPCHREDAGEEPRVGATSTTSPGRGVRRAGLARDAPQLAAFLRGTGMAGADGRRRREALGTRGGFVPSLWPRWPRRIPARSMDAHRPMTVG